MEGRVGVALPAAHPEANPPVLPGRWTVWADRYDGTPLGPIQTTRLHWSATLSGYGSGEMELVVSESPLDFTDLMRLWSWRAWVLYNDRPLWCGMPSAIISASLNTVTVQLTELSGYLTKRALDVAGGVRYDQIEQTQIARELAQPVEDIGMTIVTEPGSGFLRDRSYAFLEGPYRADLLTNLSQVIQGPEFRAEYGLDTISARPFATLRIAYPRVGTPGAQVGFIVPGDAIDPTVTYDGQLVRTKTFAVGDLPEDGDADSDRPVQIVDRPQPLIPRLDHIDDWPGVVILQTLADRAATYSTLYDTPSLAIQGSTFETDPELGTYGLGDDVIVFVRDALHPDGMAVDGRLAGLDVDCDTGKVGWTVTVTSPPSLGRPTLSARIARVSQEQTAMFRRNAVPI
jgi:hypothetical protein